MHFLKCLDLQPSTSQNNPSLQITSSWGLVHLNPHLQCPFWWNLQRPSIFFLYFWKLEFLGATSQRCWLFHLTVGTWNESVSISVALANVVNILPDFYSSQSKARPTSCLIKCERACFPPVFPSSVRWGRCRGVNEFTGQTAAKAELEWTICVLVLRSHGGVWDYRRHAVSVVIVSKPSHGFDMGIFGVQFRTFWNVLTYFETFLYLGTFW